MEIEFNCQHCSQHITADSSYAGISTQCPTCSEDIIVPQAVNVSDQKITTYDKIRNRKKPILIVISAICFVVIISTILSIFQSDKKNLKPFSKSSPVKEEPKQDPNNPTNRVSQFGLALDYHYGMYGRQKNYGEAIKWYAKSARQDYPTALMSLGLMCYEGKGFDKSISNSTEYWLLAAQSGDLSSQFEVGNIIGMRSKFQNESDMILSYFWLSLYESSDHQNSKWKSGANSQISILERNMTSQQVNVAQGMAREWKRKPVDVEKLDLLLSKTYPSAALDVDHTNSTIAIGHSNTTTKLSERGESLADVKIDGKFGYINKQGKIVIEPQFDEAGYFNEGLAKVKIGEKSGFIDQDGKFIIELKIDPIFVEPFSEGLAKVSVKLKSGFIDKSGNTIIKPQFDNAESFSEGLAAVEVGATSEFSRGKWGFIDKQGKFVIKPQFDSANSFSEGLAQVTIGSKYGYIDKQGEFVIEPKFSIIMLNGLQMNGHADSFREGLARVRIRDKYGFIDKHGNITIEPKFEGAGAFREGLAGIRYGGKSGFIDTKGKLVIKPEFDEAIDFSEGLASVKIGSKWGFIDKQGKIVISPQFDYGYGSYFDEGVARVMVGEKYGFIDKMGKFVFKP